MLNIKGISVYDENGRQSKRKALKMWIKVLLGHKHADAYIYDFPYNPERRNWETSVGNVYEKMLSQHRENFLDFIAQANQYVGDLFAIPKEQSGEVTMPFWRNTAFSPLDGTILYSIIRKFKPAIYMEVGSGNSTKFARRAVDDGRLETKILSVEPYPSPGFEKVCHRLFETPLERMPLDHFTDLKSGDVLFIDNSHRSFPGSDVTVFFTEILPHLNKGVIYGVHDIFIPYDYPEDWKLRFYNEQYLLMMYLLGGASGDELLFPVAYMSGKNEVAEALLREYVNAPPWDAQPLHGGGFWMVKN